MVPFTFSVSPASHQNWQGYRGNDGINFYSLRPISIRSINKDRLKRNVYEFLSKPRQLSKVGLVWVIIATMIGSMLLDIKVAEAYEVEEVIEIPTIEKREVRIEVVYSEESIERMIRKAFPENPDLAVAIAKAESGESLKATAFNPESHGKCNGSYGVFQIACVHNQDSRELFDPKVNIQKARALYLKEGWKPWGGYTSGGYKKFL